MKPRLLDLFCGAGGAGMGYHRAGFEVVGVDISPQPRYPFEFIQADAMTYPLAGFDFYHASPPCQDHMRSPMRGQQLHDTGWILPATRERFKATGRPWVIENVPGAPMRADLKLCACMFGHTEIRRERWFETDPALFRVWPPGCYHPGPVMNTTRTAHGPWYRKYGRAPTRARVVAATGRRVDARRADQAGDTPGLHRAHRPDAASRVIARCRHGGRLCDWSRGCI